MLNKVILIGRLGADPEMRYLSDGTPVCTLSVATSEKWKDNNGEWKEKTEWHKCQAWKKLAEICVKYLVKGSLVYCEGKITTRSWTDKDNNKRYSTEIVLNTMKMLEGKKDSGQQQPSGYEPPFPDSGSMNEEDVPF